MAADLPISWSDEADTPHSTDQRKHFPSSQVAATVSGKTVTEHMAHLDFVVSDTIKKQAIKSKARDRNNLRRVQEPENEQHS